MVGAAKNKTISISHYGMYKYFDPKRSKSCDQFKHVTSLIESMTEIGKVGLG